MLILFTLLYICSATPVPGVVTLDKYTINKVITKTNTVFVKFDKPYPYGEKEEVWKSLANAVGELGPRGNSLILGSVGIEEWGNKFNADLAREHEIEELPFPVFKLFHEGDAGILYKGEITFDAMTRFITHETMIWIGLPGCVERLDKYAYRFAEVSTKFRDDILEDAKKAGVVGLAGSYYVSTMGKIMAKPDTFVAEEETRLQKLMASGQLGDAKKKEMQTRLNILQSFKKRPPKTEKKK